ncbi:hypothetical protein F889_00898 [Acinetobacter colistiniresistens]|uniref:HlyD family efflux transporter periplasmic adaptor subunit n=1 Tax=Acinetobacter colistiniresistens TaxID=280145 RepID=N9QYS5_9GAMM|nr:HlyD family efflux transporter periplasmic adaptor subunit [Acinetobacter colistiniresistens]ENX35231.1 hypothetical protein F889_00898 [Acinetobacter colistiniresistens]EPG37972.1 hypothetical protein F907_01942 [Acinetobacter colistiniresistens]TVT84764.1 HlyD family efflux transporter periplasmic adaptor subunit [Acinetobacter colistiniresistens]
MFRKEALEAQQSKWVGHIVLLRPISFAWVTVFAAVVGMTILLFLFLGSYTKRISVTGQLMPSSGLIQVYSPDRGIVVEKLVKENQVVKRGDVLYTISTSRFNKQDSYNALLQSQIETKQQTLEQERIQTKALYVSDTTQKQNEIRSLEQDITQLGRLIEQQQHRVSLAKENVARYRDLLRREIVAEVDYQSRQDFYFNQNVQLQNYERERLAKLSDLQNRKLELAALKAKNENQFNQLNRQVATANQEFIENQASDRVIIRSNLDGVITSINAELGQHVDVTKPLLHIIPKKSELNAYLYVPSQAVGFIKLNQPIKLRYQAYPYQKFGQGEGYIYEISDTAMASQDLMSIGNNQISPSLNNQPVYLVKVKLKQKNISVYGEQRPLKVGLIFDADILQEKRKLYEWVLEPLYTISGKI